MGFDDSDFNDRFNDLIVPYKTGSVPLCFSNELNYHSPAGLSYSSSLPISEQAASDLYLWGQTLRNAGYTQRVIPKLKINPLVWILPKVQNFVQQARRVQNPFRGPLLTLNARAFKVGIARTNERQLPGICERISDTHIGTIIVTVPSHFTGGALNVAGSSNVLESSPGEQDKYFWAFVPCNMAYDFELVSSGYQIVLYCDVWLEGPNDAMTTPPNAPFQLMTQ
jgi:hypothetical protein